MVARDTQWRLAQVLTGLAAHERDLEAVRHSLLHLRPFDPFSAFRLLDRRGVGFLSSKDLLDFLSRNHCPLSPFEAHLIFRRYDADSDGKVSYSDFLAALGASADLQSTGITRQANGEELALVRLFTCERDYLSTAQRRKEDLMHSMDFSMRGVFRAIDTADKAVISPQDLIDFFARLGLVCIYEDIKRVFKALDRDKDGRISFPDFVESLMLGEETVACYKTNTEFRTSLRPVSEAKTTRNSSLGDRNSTVLDRNSTVLDRKSVVLDRKSMNGSYSSSSLQGTTVKFQTWTGRGQYELEESSPPFQFRDFLQLQIDAVRSLEEKKQNLILKADFHPLALFRMFDPRISGGLSALSFSEGLQSLGVFVTPHESFTLLKRFDQDCDGILTPDEFSAMFRPHSSNYSLMLANRRTDVDSFAFDTKLALVALFERYLDLGKVIGTAQKRFEETVKTGVAEVFARLARGNEGYFTEREMREAIEESGNDVSPAELKTLMRFYSTDHSGHVRFSTFVETVAPARPPRVL